MYNVQCTMYNVHVQCTCTMYMYNVHVHVQCTLFCMYSVQPILSRNVRHKRLKSNFCFSSLNIKC